MSKGWWTRSVADGRPMWTVIGLSASLLISLVVRFAVMIGIPAHFQPTP